MENCPGCGAPDPAPVCQQCGHLKVSQGIEAAPAAATARRGMSPRLLAAVCAGAFFVAFLIALSAARLRQPDVPPASIAATAAARPSGSNARTADAPAAVKSSASVESSPMPTWVGRRQAVWASDGTKTVAFALAPVNEVEVVSSRGQPQLVVRCLSRRTDVYIVTGPLTFEPQDGSHTVRVQVDEDPEEAQQWLDSDSSQELFAPDGAALSDRLARAHRLRVGFTPFNAQPVTMEFIVDGFDTVAPLVARTCGRRAPRPAR
jgi:hypothetical protein